jgi:hypothetical protein
MSELMILQLAAIHLQTSIQTRKQADQQETMSKWTCTRVIEVRVITMVPVHKDYLLRGTFGRTSLKGSPWPGAPGFAPEPENIGIAAFSGAAGTGTVAVHLWGPEELPQSEAEPANPMQAAGSSGSSRRQRMRNRRLDPLNMLQSVRELARHLRVVESWGRFGDNALCMHWCITRKRCELEMNWIARSPAVSQGGSVAGPRPYRRGPPRFSRAALH